MSDTKAKALEIIKNREEILKRQQQNDSQEVKQANSDYYRGALNALFQIKVKIQEL